MAYLTPAQSADLDAFLDDQFADLGLAPEEEARLRERIRQLAHDEARGCGPLGRRPQRRPATAPAPSFGAVA